MTVVLLDPLRPTSVPLEAVGLLAGGVRFASDVPAQTRELLAENPDSEVLVTASADLASEYDGRVIAAPKLPGDNLIEAAEVMDRLWSYGGWEVTQTHRSLSHYLVEETYEVLDAIEDGSGEHLREELGDLLLQVLFHSRIASASGGFDVDDVAAGLVAKLVHRSPHLADDVVGPIDIAEQERAWEIRKAAEKARQSVVDGVAMSQPPISLASKVIGRALEAGLPSDLVPEALATGADEVEAAQNALRADIDTFIVRLRAAEDRARAEGVAPLTGDDWRRFWE
ncbi:MazG family protein [Rhodococcus triatomae]|uniref:XTP/dITP diphosphohydrolase n=1 Tax=Rhodococcus triatomae TaxID=300028 RepID=A0A1G7ZYJ9_9NOCA|nr:MazG family protein [Rhodococcus triatomae]QNG17908.1 MazG family protein [Rhodococcus triatomae]QNG22424.1 MazG family protein [Rhodococcus triatomae]SDH13758.1 XTP/dITP diphosphohydrolase [Rhodococcus triatomae]